MAIPMGIAMVKMGTPMVITMARKAMAMDTVMEVDTRIHTLRHQLPKNLQHQLQRRNHQRPNEAFELPKTK